MKPERQPNPPPSGASPLGDPGYYSKAWRPSFPVKWRALLPDARDLHVYGGGVLAAAGAWTAYPPAGLIVLGALLLYLGLRVRK